MPVEAPSSFVVVAGAANHDHFDYLTTGLDDIGKFRRIDCRPVLAQDPNVRFVDRENGTHDRTSHIVMAMPGFAKLVTAWNDMRVSCIVGLRSTLFGNRSVLAFGLAPVYA